MPSTPVQEPFFPILLRLVFWGTLLFAFQWLVVLAVFTLIVGLFS
jgi:hypothetical protein